MKTGRKEMLEEKANSQWIKLTKAEVEELGNLQWPDILEFANSEFNDWYEFEFSKLVI